MRPEISGYEKANDPDESLKIWACPRSQKFRMKIDFFMRGRAIRSKSSLSKHKPPRFSFAQTFPKTSQVPTLAPGFPLLSLTRKKVIGKMVIGKNTFPTTNLQLLN
jgi:hypothetical protein